MNNKLILRTENSPYGDITKGSVLSQSDLDNNQIFLKGESISGSTVEDGIILLKKYNGNDVIISALTCDSLTGCTVISNLQSIVYQQNQLVTGSVTYLSGLTFDITPLVYIIDGVFYNIPNATQVTLASGDTTYDRIDVIYADISGNTGVIEGTPSDNPVKPGLGPDSQVEVSFVSIPAGSMSPSITTTLVYDEMVGPPTEWTVNNYSTPFVIPNSTTQAYSGTKSVRFSAATISKLVEFSSSTLFNTTNQNVIQFAIKNPIAWPSTARLQLSLLSSTNIQIGNVVQIYNGTYGFSSSNISTWQIISVPTSAFALTTPFISKLRFTVNITGTQKFNAYIDQIKFIQGIPTVSTNPNWRYMRVDSGSSIGASTPNDTLILSGGTNIGTRISGSNTIVFDLDNNIRVTGLTATTISATTYLNLPSSGVDYWTSGSTGTNSIKAINGTGLDATGTYSVATGNATKATGDTSYAEGILTTAGGQYSHAEGAASKALGYTSHAEGVGTTASNDGTHSEGSFTIASGVNSHSEGANTRASGDYSHSEGFGSTGSGEASHAEGNSTTASGDTSHAEGYLTTAGGSYSHSEGESTTVSGSRSHVGGYLNDNRADYSFIGSGSGNTIYSASTFSFIGGGTNNTILNAGPPNDSSHSFIGGGSGNTISSYSKYSSIVGGFNNVISATTDGSPGCTILGGLNNLAVKNTTASLIGGGDNILGSSLGSSNYTFIFGRYNSGVSNGSVILGQANHFTGDSVNVIGNSNTLNSALFNVIGDNNIGTSSTNARKFIIGSSNNVDISSGLVAAGIFGESNTLLHSGSYIIGNGITSTTENTVFIPKLSVGEYNIVSGTSVYVGGSASTGTTNSSFVHGIGSIAGGGEIINVQNPYSVFSACTITDNDPVYNMYAVVFSGDVTTQWFDYITYCPTMTLSGGTGSSFTIDCNTVNDIQYDIGTDSTYFTDTSITDLSFTNISFSSYTETPTYFNRPAFGLGVNVNATGAFSFATGRNTIASGNTSHAEGSGTTAGGAYSHAEGINSITIPGGTASHVEGVNTTASGGGAHAEGQTTKALGDSAHAEGDGTNASTYAAHAEGFQTFAGYVCHAEGNQTTANGNWSHAEGGFTIATGNTSHAEGNLTSAFGQFSHAEGNATAATGNTSHAEGSSTRAWGSSSHAEGSSTTAIGGASHAEGSSTTVLSDGSHAEGYSTLATGGLGSHVEGVFSTSSNIGAHAEGSITTASGYASHAEGYRTTASGDISHASGGGSLIAPFGVTLASGHGSFVHGSASTASGSYSIVLGNNITGTTSNTVYVPKLNLALSGTPSSSADAQGENGSVLWDNNYFYWKANNQWLRVSGSTF